MCQLWEVQSVNIDAFLPPFPAFAAFPNIDIHIDALPHLARLAYADLHCLNIRYIVYLTCLLPTKYHSAAVLEAAYQLGYVYFEQRYRRG